MSCPERLAAGVLPAVRPGVRRALPEVDLDTIFVMDVSLRRGGEVDSRAVPVLVFVIMLAAYIGGMTIVGWFDRRRIEAAVLQAGGKVESITDYGGYQKLESWRDLNYFGPRCYKVRRGDADGVTRTNAVIVGVFSGIEWGDSVR